MSIFLTCIRFVLREAYVNFFQACTVRARKKKIMKAQNSHASWIILEWENVIQNLRECSEWNTTYTKFEWVGDVTVFTYHQNDYASRKIHFMQVQKKMHKWQKNYYGRNYPRAKHQVKLQQTSDSNYWATYVFIICVNPDTKQCSCNIWLLSHVLCGIRVYIASCV